MTMPSIEEKKALDLQNMNVRLSIRFNFVLFPFDVSELLEQLGQAGYFPMIPSPPKLVGQVRLNYKGMIAQKGTVGVEINDDRGVIAVVSPVPDLTIQGFNEVLQIVKDKLGVDLMGRADFYEMLSSFDVNTGKNALESMVKFNEKNGGLAEIGKMIGQEVSGFTLRIIPKSGTPSSTDWFDMTIEPNVIKPRTNYKVLSIFRSKEKSKVDDFIRSFGESLARIFEAIEA